MRRDEMGVDEVYSKLWYKIGKTYNNNNNKKNNYYNKKYQSYHQQ